MARMTREVRRNHGHNGHRDAYQRGPVLLRGTQIPEETHDARLLQPGQDIAWLHQDPWRVMRIQAEFVEGFGALADLGPAISVFGSARVRADDPEYALAEEIGRRLSRPGSPSSPAAGRA